MSTSLNTVDIDGNQLLRCILNKAIEKEKSANGDRADCIKVVIRELALLQVANAITINTLMKTVNDIAEIYVGEHFDNQFFDKN